VGEEKPRRGDQKMQSPDLTTWLEMVWDALSEQDALKRNDLLRAADAFLRRGNHKCGSALRFVDDSKAAA
jgi:hypothetical protein